MSAGAEQSPGWYAYRINELRDKLTDAVDAGDIEEGYKLLGKLQVVMQRQDRDAEVDKALAVLDKHGVSYKVWGRKDVYELLDQLPVMGAEDKDKIVDHVTEGDDWKLIEDVVDESAAQKIWEIIAGTASDHREWFSEAALRKL